MDTVDQLMSAAQYSLPAGDKENLLRAELSRLTRLHDERCPAYHGILEALWPNAMDESGPSWDSMPFVPVRLFKQASLQSVPENAVVRVLTSSGTTGQGVSRIVLDRETAQLQTRALAAIVTSFIGPKRLPMLIVDTPSVLKPGSAMSARAAGLVGLANFGRDHFYALDDNMTLDLAGLRAFAARHAGEPVLVFGFTYMVWEYFCEALARAGEQVSLGGGILIHSGGWKKMADRAVTPDHFKRALRELCALTRVHNFYGMVEQVGSVYMECEAGFLHAPNFADIRIRDHRDWSVCSAGQQGLVQTVSVLPRSYPGHSILTEDLGVVVGVDGCLCGRRGTHFKLQGRMPMAELRGCSDTHVRAESREALKV